MTRVDAHCHFWSVARDDYVWLRPDDPALASIYRDFAPSDMAPLAGKASISRYVAVQAAPTEDETRYLLGLAERRPEIAGVVGWVDLTTADAPERIESLAANPVLKGLRPMLQDLSEDDWINTRPTGAALDALQRTGLRFDALVLPRHLLPLERFIASRPSQSVVVDHAAKPALGADADDPRHALWQTGMKRLSAIPHVHCKLSGLLTEMRPDQCKSVEKAVAVLRPVTERLLEWFGPGRLIWGSDWPVLTLAASHEFWIAVTDILLSNISTQEKSDILGGNAVRFYGLGEEKP